MTDQQSRTRSEISQRDSLSVIIPTIKPLALIQPMVAALEDHLRHDDEIIVAQAEGTEREIPETLAPRTRLIGSPRGRGFQLHLGALEAKGDVFLFLHDDSILPAGFDRCVRAISTAPEISLGCFELSFHPSSRSLDLIAGWANLRTRIFRLPYGDQGLFCRREIFRKVGGFKKKFLMEDVDFVRSCRQWGRLMIVREKIRSSPSRYMRRGVLRAGIRSHFTMLQYRLGVDDGKLYSFYYRD
jgi:rSAM/selenodomain-associated transferase 2